MIRYSTRQDDVIQAADHFVASLLGMDKTVIDILDATKRFKNEFILNLYTAIFYLYGQSEQAMVEAKKHFNKAKKLKSGITHREALLLEGAFHQFNRDYQRAIDCYYLINQADPQDLLATKLAEFCFFCLGQAYESRQYINYTNSLLAKNKQNSDFLGMHSFAHELSNHFDASLRFANEAIALKPSNAWAHHTLSHYYIRRKQLDEGIEVFGGLQSHWLEKDVAIQSHNFWHLALLYLENGDFSQTENLYKTYSKNFPADLVCVNIDNISLLWRMELAGKSMKRYWSKLANNISNYAMEQFTPFLNAHFFYALGRANREDKIQEAMERYLQYAEKQTGFYHRNWFAVGKNVMEGMVDFASENWSDAADKFRPYIDIIGCIGGSDAQVDIFKQTYLVALINAKKWNQARNFLKKRAGILPLTHLEASWMEKIEKGLA